MGSAVLMAASELLGGTDVEREKPLVVAAGGAGEDEPARLRVLCGVEGSEVVELFITESSPRKFVSDGASGLSVLRASARITLNLSKTRRG